MAQINDPKVTGTRYFFQGREKRNVTSWAQLMNRAEFKAYKDPAHYAFYEKKERYEDGSSALRFFFGRKDAPLGQGPKEAFRIERDAYATERFNEMMSTTWEF